jgi:uncharacterized Zn finger protein
VLGEALDGDPFLLFELRGKTKDQVLAALRAVRGGTSEAPAKKGIKTKAVAEDAEVPTVKLGKLEAADYDRPRVALPALRFMFDEPLTHGAVLRQLGAPAAWQNDASPADVLAPMVRAAAETARRIALVEPAEAEDLATKLAPTRRAGQRRSRQKVVPPR